MKPFHSMLDFDEARRRLLHAARAPTATQHLALLQAAGLTLANPVVSPINVPGFDNSAMDGYALAVGDFSALPEVFPVGQRIAAGQTGMPLQVNTAARIFTGAPTPPGCNAIVPQEHTSEQPGGVQLNRPVQPGQHIRHLGEDIAAGATVLTSGQRLGPQHLAMAASVGVATLTVFQRLQVGVLFTGDELTEPGQPLAPGAIYNSNRYAIVAMLHQLGCVVQDYGIVRDSALATREALARAAAENDVIITCGGVSVGEEDHVKAAVQVLGKLDLWQISMKPGKPLAYGTIGQADFIGLPGNPVSAFVTFMLLARPFLQKRMGMPDPGLQTLTATAGFDWPRPDKRREFLRVRFDPSAPGNGMLQRWGNQGSGVMSSIAWADGLVDIAPATIIRQGDQVRYIPLSSLLN